MIVPAQEDAQEDRRMMTLVGLRYPEKGLGVIVESIWGKASLELVLVASAASGQRLASKERQIGARFSNRSGDAQTSAHLADSVTLIEPRFLSEIKLDCSTPL